VPDRSFGRNNGGQESPCLGGIARYIEKSRSHGDE
jgi:hypothetical protein